MPGTLTNEAPEIDVPIMPKATSHHGDCRLPRKKALLSPLLDVKCEIRISTPKYASTTITAVYALIIIYV